MRYLVLYDISDERRLRRVAKACEDYGLRIQKSVFECDLDAARFRKLWAELLLRIEESEDSLMAWPLCASCAVRAVRVGTAFDQSRELAWVC